MLWEYTQILFMVAGLASVLSFHRAINDIGQIFFLLVGGSSWFAFGISLLKITFKWGGSQNVVSYTYIPSTEAPFVYLFMAMGGIMFALGCWRAWNLVFSGTQEAYAELDVG